MKKSSVLSVALIVCLVLLAGGAWLLFGQNAGLTYANAEKYSGGDTTITSPVKNLDVNWTEGSVSVVYHAGSDIRIAETSKRALSDDLRVQWWLDGDTLRVQYAKPGFHLAFDLQKALTISLPEGAVLDTANIHATSAEMSVQGLAARDVTLSSTSGNQRALVKAEQFQAASTSGDQAIHLQGDCQRAVFSSTSGNIDAMLETVGEATLTATSGHIAVNCAGSVDTLKLHTTSGAIQADGVRAKTADVSSTSGNIILNVLAFDRLNVSCTSGAVTAALPRQPGFTCTVRTASGAFDSDIALNKSGNTYTCGDGSAVCDIHTTSGNIRIK